MNGDRGSKPQSKLYFILLLLTIAIAGIAAFWIFRRRQTPGLETTVEIPSEVELKSEVGVDYGQLQELLSRGQWREANEETDRVMLEAVNRESEGWMNVGSLKQFPCDDLRTIDRLWIKHSDGQFGYSVQKQIYRAGGATLDGEFPGDKILGRFVNEVGWRKRGGWLKRGEWLEEDELTFSIEGSPGGHLPAAVVRERWGGAHGALGVYLFGRVADCDF